MIVIDASIALSWFLVDERDDVASRSAALVMRERAVVPAIFPLEVTNALVAAVRRGRLSADDAELALERLAELPVRVAAASIAPMLVMRAARTHELSAYDAAYLALAKEERLPLLTRDARLAKAAARERLPSP